MTECSQQAIISRLRQGVTRSKYRFQIPAVLQIFGARKPAQCDYLPFLTNSPKYSQPHQKSTTSLVLSKPNIAARITVEVA